MRLLFFIVFCLASHGVMGQNNSRNPNIHDNIVFDKKIKTVLLHREDWNLSYPIIKLNSSEKLVLHFDLLDNQPETYYYTFIHCTKDWTESDVFIQDYLEGLEENPIEEYNSSFNTTVPYFHYKLSFPNERSALKISGNYVIVIFRPGERENPVLKQRFTLSEDAVKIDVNAHRPQMTESNNTHQQVDFNVRFAGIQINDPYRNIYSFVLQNGRWDKARENMKADFYGDNELKYSSLSNKNIFAGGNEFRYFDIKSIRYLTEYVRITEYAAPYYNVYLQPSDNREFKPYFYWKDFNGKYFIAFQEGRNAETDADYVYVYFTLPSGEELPAGNMYVSGAFNNWKLDMNNLMSYNREKKQYECAILLKQGWYNYEYVFAKNGETAADAPFEGNHYETENDYLVLIYYRNPRERFDRCLGAAIENTLNRLSD